MIANRSVPPAVMPELPYDDVAQASEWLCHRAQLVLGDGAFIVKSGAKILHPPTDYPFGERQYNAEDLGGHVWTFSQSIADVDPASWGGILR